MRCLLVVVNGLSTQVINKPSALNVALSLHYYKCIVLGAFFLQFNPVYNRSFPFQLLLVVVAAIAFGKAVVLVHYHLVVFSQQLQEVCL